MVFIDPEGLRFRDWYMGGMGGASDWVDRNMLFGQTRRFGRTAGCYDAGQASGWDVAWEGAKWGALVGVEAYAAGSAVVAGARAGALGVMSRGRALGFTKHGLGRMAERNVPLRAVADAVRNPLKVLPPRLDPRTMTYGTKYVGKDAAVVLNDAAKVVTVFPQ